MGLIDLDGSNYRHSQINSKTSFLPSIMPPHFYATDLPTGAGLGGKRLYCFGGKRLGPFWRERVISFCFGGRREYWLTFILLISPNDECLGRWENYGLVWGIWLLFGKLITLPGTREAGAGLPLSPGRDSWTLQMKYNFGRQFMCWIFVTAIRCFIHGQCNPYIVTWGDLFFFFVSWRLQSRIKVLIEWYCKIAWQSVLLTLNDRQHYSCVS